MPRNLAKIANRSCSMTELRVVGLMSGTSADGIDLIVCDINGAPPRLTIRTCYATVYSYDADFQKRIHAACLPESSEVDELCRLNAALGERFTQAVIRALDDANIPRDSIDLIGSHGQTLWHQVEADGRVSATLQIGEAAIIAEHTGITTISNFRPRDVAVGGQGAPLTGYADWLLLRHDTQWRAVQNIGGMGNVTFLPPLKDENSAPLAFDTGPGNALIDCAVSQLTGARYDQNGTLARQGIIDETWLAELLDHPYYRRQPPKTTGRELFGETMAQTLIAQAQSRGLSTADTIATLTMLTAQTIADAYQRFSPARIGEIILGGGGRHNPVLVGMLHDLTNLPVRTHEDIGMDSDSKEALVFALLAYETWHNRPGIHPALTGASHPVVLGQITPGANYESLIRKTWL